MKEHIRELDRKKKEIFRKEFIEMKHAKLETINYESDTFTYDNETCVIKRNRIETIQHYPSSQYYKNTIIPGYAISINYKPIGTTRINAITINCYTEEVRDKTYKKLRKLFFGIE